MPSRADAKDKSANPKPAKSRDRKEKPKEGFGEILKTVIYALLIALAFRTVFFQPFTIPSGSMKETLLVGDYLFVSKFSYGYSRHSCPMGACPIEDRLWGSEPERGDVIVFKRDQRGGCEEGVGPKLGDWLTFLQRQVGLTNTRRRVDCIDYIKRLVGMPGDVMRMDEGVLHINGEPVKRERLGEFREAFGSGPCLRREVNGNVPYCVHELWRETLPNGASYNVLNSDENRSRSDNTSPITVPEGHYFFMGDNRDNSQDSRMTELLGTVPYDRLVGRAEIIFLSSEGAFWEIWKWRFSRFFSWIE
jgi:signal peptidase I